MIDFHKLASEQAGLIEKEALNRINTMIECAILNVETSEAKKELEEIANQVKTWLKNGLTVQTQHNFIQLGDAWYNPEKNIRVSDIPSMIVYQIIWSGVCFSVKKEDESLSSLLARLS